MAGVVHCISSSTSRMILPMKPKHSCITSSTSFRSLSFSNSLSSTSFFSEGSRLSMKTVEKSSRLRSIVCEAAPPKKADSAAKRARQAEKRRIYNKGKKSEAKTRMRKVLDALAVLKKNKEAQSEEILSIEKLIAEAYSAIDKAVKAGSLHRNTGANRKSRLARRKKAIEIHHGWYTPSTAVTA